MADLSLKIKADFEEASRQFKALAQDSESAQKKIEDFTNGFQDDQIDKFIDRQKLAGTAITATKGNLAATEAQHAAYGREIERLIKSGLDPESEAIRKLKSEYDNLGTEIDKARARQDAWERTVQAAGQALKVVTVAAAAAGAAILAATQATATAGDQYAKASRVVGMTAETLQELEYAAKQSGLSSDTLKSSLQKLNKTVADVKGGTGALNTYLKANNPALLEQFKDVNSNEEAFNLLMGALKKCPNEFDRATLAQAAFGKSGQQMILMAKDGTKGIADLREEARKYGIISNESVAASEAYMDAQTRMKAALEGVRNAFSEKLLPSITDFTNRITGSLVKVIDFVKGIENLPDILTNIGIAVGGVVIALGAMVVIDKIGKGMAALNLILAANPFIAIAAAVALVVTGIILLYKNWDMVVTYLQQGIAYTEYGFKWLGSQIKEKFITAINGIKIAFMTVVDVVQGKVLGAVAKLLDVMGKLPFVGDQFKAASASVRTFSENITASIEAVKQESRDLIKAAQDEQAATERTQAAKLAAINAEAAARREAIRQRQKDNDTEQAEAAAKAAAAEAAAKKTSAAQVDSLRERLSLLGDTEAQAEEQRQSAFTQFLQARLDAEKLSGDDRLAYLQEQAQMELDTQKFSEEERLSAQAAFNEMVLMEEQRLSNARIAIKQAEVEATAGLFGDMSKLADQFSEESRAALILSKLMSLAQVGINTAVGITNAIAQFGPPPSPMGIAGIASAIINGTAATAMIIKQMIPSAETGGRFIVPNTSSGVDGHLYRLNAGEEVNVTPRGMAGGESRFNFNFVFDEHYFAQIINKLARSGELYTLQLAGNY